MNIYLDIDGVLLANENCVAAHADEFLRAVLAMHPDNTYWLTTHCWQGENRAVEVLRSFLEPETVELLSKVKPTEWGEAKTDAIDFTQPFLWFDDDLYPDEEVALRTHDALGSWVGVDLAKDPGQLEVLLARIAADSRESIDKN